MKIYSLLLLSNVYCTSFFLQQCKRLFIKNINGLKLKESVIDVCEKNKNQSVVLLLDEKMDYKLQCYLLGITENDLLTFSKDVMYYLYQDVLNKDALKTMNTLISHSDSTTLNKYYSYTRKIKKGRLYILFQDNIHENISFQSHDLISQYSIDINQFNIMMTSFLKIHDNDPITRFIFFIKTSLLYYVCCQLIENLDIYIENLKIIDNKVYNSKEYETIKKNLGTLVNHAEKLDPKENFENYLSKFKQFLDAVYGNEFFQTKDDYFHNYFKRKVCLKTKARIFNQLKMVTTENDIELKEGFIEHILRCVRQFLVQN